MVKKSSGFVYRRRDASSVRKRQTQSGSSREGYINPDIPIWSARKGDNKVRMLPPTWKDAQHYGMDIYVHYGVGLDNNTVVCLAKNKDLIEPETCPVCEMRQQYQADGNDEYAEILRDRKRVLAYIIDRSDEDKGIQLWPMPFTVDRDVALVSQDEENGEMLFVDDPKEGYDVLFRRDGEGQTTKYVAVKVGRRPTPLSNDRDQAAEWLDFINENPLPDQVVIADAEHIEELLEGGVATGDRKKGVTKAKGRRGRDDDEEEDEPPRRRGRSRHDEDEDEEEERPRSRRRAAADDDEDEDEPAPRRRKPIVDDEDEEEEALRGPRSRRAKAKPEADEDDEDEDDKPKSRRVKAKDEDEDEEEDEAPRSRRRKAAAAEDDDEDEEEEVKRASPKLRTGGAKSKLSKLSRR